MAFGLFKRSSDGTAESGGGAAAAAATDGQETNGAAADPTTPYEPYQSTDAPGRPRDAQVVPAPPRPVPGVYRPNRPYSGFSTSICSLFQFTHEDDEAAETNTARVDCCAMACFGILQSDRTRFLLTGITPPSIFRRMWMHIFLPLGIFIFAGFCAIMIQDQYANSFLSTFLVLVLFVYILMGCLRGTVKRSRVREEMLWRMRELDMRAEGRGDEARDSELRARVEEEEHGAHGEDLGQSSFARSCVHRMFGCAVRDLPTKDGEPEPSDFCGKLWKFFANLCCGAMCGCWFQFCGVCALAQEAREIERLVPVGRRRIDYITFEPYVAYYNPIKALRAARNSSLVDHYHALSHLSLMLVKSLGVAVVTVFLLSLITYFEWGDMVVFLLTLCQAFFIQYFVHWKWNRFDISLDAVIKFFACGFCLTTGLAVFFELVETIFFQLILLLFVTIAGIEEVETQDFDSTPSFGGGGGYTLNTSSYSRGHGRFLQDQADDFAKTFALEYPIIVIMYLFVNAFLMAALVEELCKYFGYRMVEHPDFLTDEQMAEAEEAAAAVAAAAAHHEGDEDGEEGGGGVGDDAASQASEEGGAGGGAYKPPVQAGAAAAATAASQGGDGADIPILPEAPRSLNSRGAAVTVAMVSVALGFACCENLIYIFVYNGGNLSREIAVLIARSLFPIHPIAAAIQSIGVCKRDLEGDKTLGVGKTILPAVILHGSFDFILMLTSFLISLKGMNAQDDESYVAKGEIISFVLSLCMALGGMGWYVKESRAQTERLNRLDQSLAGSGLQEHTGTLV